MMPYDVVSVTPLPQRRLSVRFADGLSGKVVLRDTHLYGVFSALKDPAVFMQCAAIMASSNGPATLTWPRTPCTTKSRRSASGFWNRGHPHRRQAKHEEEICDPFSPVRRGEGWDEGSGQARPLTRRRGRRRPLPLPRAR